MTKVPFPVCRSTEPPSGSSGQLPPMVSHRPRKRLIWYLFFLLLFCDGLEPISCSRQPFGCHNNSDHHEIRRYFYVDDQTVDLRLAVSDRYSHQLVTHILKILLEDVVGYTNVTLVRTNDYMNATLGLNRIAGCPLQGLVPRCQDLKEWETSKIPETMVDLEVWMGPGFNTEAWVNFGRLEHCGPLGPVGRFGWFVPQYLTDDAKRDGMGIIDHWRALLDDKVARLLDLSDDLDRVRAMTIVPDTNEHYCNFSGCRDGIYYPPWCSAPGAVCATLLSLHPAISNGMIRDLINYLRLKVKVAWIGPRLEHYVHERTLRHLPVLFFSWKPNNITFTKNYTNVAFPRCEDLQFGPPFPSNCAFEINQLNKVAWGGLKASGDEAMHVVKAMTFTQAQYQNLLQSFVERSASASVADVACDWVKHNTASWHSWIPSNLVHKIPLYIGGIFPISGVNYISKGIIPAVKLAIEAVNRNQTILKDFELNLLIEDGQCSADHVMKSFIKYVHGKEFTRLLGILGPACSDTVEPLAGVAKHYHSIIISYSAEGAIFNNNKDYPYFFRTIPSNKQFKNVYLPFFKHMGWTRVATLTEEGMKYPEYLSLTQDFLQSHGINFIVNRKFPRDRVSNNMTQYLDDLKKKNARIIIGDFYDIAARAIMCEAYRQGMTAYQGYVWFFPRWFANNWYDTDSFNQLEADPVRRVPCTSEEMRRAANGYMSLAYSYYNDNEQIMQENISVGEWRNKYHERISSDKDSASDDYAGYAYDAVWVYALAADKLLKQNHSYIATLHTQRTARKFVEILNETNFQGVSGNIQFVGPSRVSVIYILQWVDGKTRHVGRFLPKPQGDGILQLNESVIMWFTPGKKVPGDGREEPSQCALESIRQLLDVDCEVAIVVVNIVGFGLFAILMLTCFIFIKHRYEQRVRMTEQRMKELGLMTASNMLELDQWEINRDCVVINRKIGEGAFGTVYGGEVQFEEKGWVPVAVKTLKVGSSIEEKLDFLSEAEMMKRFDHQNVVRLLGVCTRGEPVYTIMEFMLYGDLKTYLLARRHMVSEKNREEMDEVSNSRLTSMALDVARGLSYLAEMKYVHRDLACRNCLVNTMRVVKLADFGMTRPMYDSDYYKLYKKGMLPVRWMAPESLVDGMFTPHSDIWSYGVLLFEIVTFGSFPYQGLSNNQVLEHVKRGNTLAVPNGCKSQLEELLIMCWQRNPTQRPSAFTLVETLADSPELVTPCLDMPLASVEIEGTDSLDFQIPDRGRRFSVSHVVSSRLSVTTTPAVSPAAAVTSFAGGLRKRSDTIDNAEITPLCGVGHTADGMANGRGSLTTTDNGIRLSRSADKERWNGSMGGGGNLPSPPPSFNAKYITLQHPHPDGKTSPTSTDYVGLSKDSWNKVTSL